MENKEQILKMIEDYKLHFNGEEERAATVISFLYQFDGDELVNRKNFTGHITASAYMINNEKNALLLLKHKALQRWLQPGGHVDASDESLIKAAIREAQEETGIQPSNLITVKDIIFDIDSHIIPANFKKNEPEHIHHDISFLFHCKTSDINVDENESTAGKWVSFSELSTDEEYEDVISKIKSLI